MGQHDSEPQIPPRILAALRYLDHTYCLTRQDDVSLPQRTLTTLEKSVEAAALRTLQSYFLGEMDFGDAPPRVIPPSGDDDANPAPVPEPKPA